MLKRQIEEQITKYLSTDAAKIFFLWGPRRSGKTTILKAVGEQIGERVFNFDFLSDREFFIPDKEVLGKLAREHKVILIDEVQTFPESTVSLKLLHDEYKRKIIATGSSELRKKSQQFDSLAGRYSEHYCLPLSVKEAWDNSGCKAYEQKQWLDGFTAGIQIFGAYPEILADNLTDEAKIDLLTNILETYVLKDIADIYNLKNVKLARDILTKIALQLGSEASLREIAGSLGANVETVSNYVEIFTKNYILFPIQSYRTNVRRAVSSNRKYYFYDLGIRNALVRDFRRPGLRPDKGGVFENLVLSELKKMQLAQQKQLSLYYYREYAGKEVDLVTEDYQKKYRCFEIKSGRFDRQEPVFPLPHEFETITPVNYFQTLRKTLSAVGKPAF